MLKGSFVALVTPFRNGEVDWGRLEKLVDFHVEGGTAGLVPCGTTGEAATLSPEERHDVVKAVVDRARGRVPVIAGAGSNCTKEAIKHGVAAERAGAEALLVVTPYYNKPMQEGLAQHYRAVASEVGIPIVLYNVPGRTGVNLMPETVAELSLDKRFIGIKEASGSPQQVSDIIASVKRKDFAILSGDDSLTVPIIALGGHGVVSVAANVVPGEMAKLVKYSLNGDLVKAREVHERLLGLFRVLFVETNPIPVKAAMAMLGMVDGEMRLPMTPLSETNKVKLRGVLLQLGLLE